MNEIKRILFVDDECESIKEDFESSFNQKRIEIVFCKTKEEGINELNARRHYDLILLDWFLQDPESNIMSIAFLSELRKIMFVPVFIWTHHYDNYEQELLKNAIPYPKDLIRGISKEEFESQQLQEKLAELYETCNITHLSDIYRATLHQKLEQVFFELSEISGISLIKMIKSIVGENNNIDWSNDLILNFIHRQLLVDNDFIQKIKNFLSTSSAIESTDQENIKKIFINKIMYYKPQPNRLRCGDIISIKDSEGNSKRAIIINPDCDLSNPNTRYIELIELRSLDDPEMKLTDGSKTQIKMFNHHSFYYFPSLEYKNVKNDFVAILKSKIVLMERVDINNSRYPQSSKQLDYKDYYSIGETIAELEFICSLDEPYKSDFLNHVHSHDLRIGIPDIKKLWS